LVEQAQEAAPRLGARTLSVKVGADFDRSNSWQLGWSQLYNRRQAVQEDHEDHEGEEGAHADHQQHGARFSGRRMSLVDLTWKWAPDGDGRHRQVRLGVEAAQINGVAGADEPGARHSAQAIALVWRWHSQWELGARLDALRVLQQRDEFELTALDFCVTHETAPPLWVAPLCRLLPTGASAPLPLPASAADPQPPGVSVGPVAELMLCGELRGDMPATLAELQRPMPAGVLLVVSCTKLVRVDFSAAGSLLTWTMARQQAGGTVRFDDVPHLVAAFFHVIGINEHAGVVLRTR
jgi:ABC-type transporter Mla MlaB component